MATLIAAMFAEAEAGRLRSFRQRRDAVEDGGGGHPGMPLWQRWVFKSIVTIEQYYASKSKK